MGVPGQGSGCKKQQGFLKRGVRAFVAPWVETQQEAVTVRMVSGVQDRWTVQQRCVQSGIGFCQAFVTSKILPPHPQILASWLQDALCK